MTTLKNNKSFYLGSWLVTPEQNKLENYQQEVFIEPKLMDVLSCLCINAPAIMSVDKLIEKCWPKQFIGDNPLHKCITQLRKVLGDTIKNPQYIKTITKRGYTIIAEIKGKTLVNGAKWNDMTPYLGSKQYKVQHQAIYFGRSKAIAEIKTLIENITHTDLPLLLLEGLSTVGKTSLVNTAIIPYLETQEKPHKYQFEDSLYYDFKLHRNDSALHLFINYLKKVKILNTNIETAQLLNELKTTLVNFQLPNKDTTADNEKSHESNSLKKIIFIDHFEKFLIENNNENELDLLFMLIIRLLNTDKYFIIISVRSENYQALYQSLVFNSVKPNIIHYNLLPPNNSEIAEIIQKPVLAAGLSYEINQSTFVSLDKAIIDDARNMGNILPILSHSLKELCEFPNEKQQLTFDRYHKTGKLAGALTCKVKHIIDALSDNEKKRLAKNLHLLIQYNPTGEIKYISKTCDLKLVQDNESIKLINYLITQGMFQSHHVDSQRYVSILHDSILSQCDFFKRWIDKNHLKLAVISEVKILTDQWLSHGKNEEYLLRNNYLLEQANSLIKKDKIVFNINQCQFLKLSRHIHNKKLKVMYITISMLVLLPILFFTFFAANKQNNIEPIKISNNTKNLTIIMVADLTDKLKLIEKLEQLDIIDDQFIYHNIIDLPQPQHNVIQK